MISTKSVLIVENGFTRGALAATRALAHDGWTVGIGAPTKGLAASSRYCSRWHRVPPVEDGLDRFLDATRRALDDGEYEAVFCSSDAEALALSFGRDRLGAERVPYAAHDAVVRSIDKVGLTEAAQKVGLATPETMIATDEALDRLDGEVLVKPRLHWQPGHDRSPARMEATVCTTAEETRARVAEIRAAGGEAILQEVVIGRLLHYMALVDKGGKTVAVVETLAEPLFCPPHIGQRVRSHSIPTDQERAARVADLFTELSWTGLASLNFLLPADGVPRLIDLNGRYSASFDQYIKAGPNFPALWARLATGRPLPEIPAVRPGVRFQWLEGDLRRAVVERRGGLIRDVLDSLHFAIGAEHTLFKLRDPAPGMRFLARLARRGVAKARRHG